MNHTFTYQIITAALENGALTRAELIQSCSPHLNALQIDRASTAMHANGWLQKVKRDGEFQLYAATEAAFIALEKLREAIRERPEV